MRTAQSIEEAKAQKPQRTGETQEKYPPGKHPRSLANLKVAPWKPGQSGNPGGRPKHDVGAEIARAVLANNMEAAYVALTRALLKGNAYVFKELSDRGFGKMKERIEVVNPEELSSRLTAGRQYAKGKK